MCLSAVAKAAALVFDAARGWALPPERFGELERFVAAVAKSGHELRAYDDALDFVARRRDADHRAETLARLFPQGMADPGLAKLLKAPLYPYQAEGALFAVRAGRALIGDEMGLGKTIQLLSLVAGQPGGRPTLLVCPLSLAGNWQREAARFTPDLRAHVHHGADRLDGQSLDEAGEGDDLGGPERGRFEPGSH